MTTPAPTRSPAFTGRTETVSSRDNRWLKMFRAALRGAGSLDEGVAAVEGARLVDEALGSGLEVPAVLFSASAEKHLTALETRLPESARLLRVSDRLFQSVSGTQSPQGIAALVHPRAAGFDALTRPSAGHPLVAVLVGVQDPGNLGTVIRAAEAFGASGAIVTAGAAHPWSPKALRASAGSTLRLPVVHGIAPPVALAQLRIAGFRTYAASTAGSALPSEVDLTAPVALLIGNEGAGLPPEIERSADSTLRIPLAAPVDSLNAAMAATVLLYEAARQRGFAP
ncbi:MAG: TrmH family RNA methyltransferase [Candidatus Acidiferrales bacterium]